MMCSFSTDNQRRPFLLWKDIYFSISLRMLKNNFNMNQLITIGACILTICFKKSQSNASSILGGQEEILIVLPVVRIPEREERRLPKQCNSQKKGSLLLTRIRAPAARPTQWYGVREPRAEGVIQIYKVCISGQQLA